MCPALPLSPSSWRCKSLCMPTFLDGCTKTAYAHCQMYAVCQCASTLVGIKTNMFPDLRPMSSYIPTDISISISISLSLFLSLFLSLSLSLSLCLCLCLCLSLSLALSLSPSLHPCTAQGWRGKNCEPNLKCRALHRPWHFLSTPSPKAQLCCRPTMLVPNVQMPWCSSKSPPSQEIAPLSDVRWTEGDGKFGTAGHQRNHSTIGWWAKPQTMGPTCFDMLQDSVSISINCTCQLRFKSYQAWWKNETLTTVHHRRTCTWRAKTEKQINHQHIPRQLNRRSPIGFPSLINRLTMDHTVDPSCFNL